MEQIPDAPWIRAAERDGYPADDPVECPVCGWECETIYRDRNREVFGCDRCIWPIDAWEWYEERKEAEKPDG